MQKDPVIARAGDQVPADLVEEDRVVTDRVQADPGSKGPSRAHRAPKDPVQVVLVLADPAPTDRAETGQSPKDRLLDRVAPITSMPTATAKFTAGINRVGRNAIMENGPSTDLHNLQTVHVPQAKGDLRTLIAKAPQEIAVPPEPGITNETAVTDAEVPAAAAHAVAVHAAAAVLVAVGAGEEEVAEAEDDRQMAMFLNY